MKKFLISTLCVASLALTACDKKPASGTASGSGSTAATAPAVTLSTNNAADIKNDLIQIQTLSNTKAQEAVNFQTEVMKAAQSGDKNAVGGMIDKMKAFIEGFNKELDTIPYKSTEVSKLKDKMKETNMLGVEMAQASIANPPDMNKINQLQQKAAENQKALLTEMQALQTKANTAK